ncbi:MULTISPECIES: phosphate ABC transporter ATP-binding protein PstB [Paenibacillus]|uniref:Phosphate ABC transporter ATP-binding protein n=1 Tax=Paenibacillus lautus TaxID=1401 RepID=A0A385U3D3_PAELA|nr:MULTISPECIES: phosphate ABC transporter ATP-binding protein PstB [Paenibacillus]AWP25183.1 phosphate ABC transporter ATP-binding protein [Paenibacillus sp. Cedars]AYB48095.1 phosphate ABC transporter ATP-binding protein [Paenibacillus lautus]MBX4152570.1 phosphate ABC transporter ATP-binding protein PstB [Paenibacillus lautus]VTR56574.1 phosphate import ATP-binding protein PstB [Actinobacillus pleuropneumoniae]
MNAIKIKSLSVHYGEKQALKDITMDMPAKSITALIGPSGCGKSTLLRMINRMNDHVSDLNYEGQIFISGYSVYEKHVQPEMLRKKVGMVFQQPNPFPKSIYDNIAYGPRLHGKTKKAELDDIVEKSLKDAALWDEVKDLLKKSALNLSGGQQQRLCIARALAIHPDILLMDESTAALDPLSTMKIEELVTQLKSDYTIVMVTHNLHQAARVSDQSAFFLNGQLVEYSITEDIFTKPRDLKTEHYISGRFG